MRLKTAPDDSLDEWVKKLYTEVIEAWRVDYDEYRPHQSLNDRTSMEFVTEHQSEICDLPMELF